MTQPGSTVALAATTADGWIRVASERPSPTNRSTMPRRATAPMAGRIGRPGSNAA